MSESSGMTEDRLRRYLKRTVAELDSVTGRLDEVEYRAREPIAVVGMACRFPGGVDSPEAFWEFIRDGGDAIAEAPTDRGWPPAPRPRLGGLLAEPGAFDAAFFGISPREALATDPQQRLMLEISWEALERAGFDPSSLRGSAGGVFTGVGAVDYGPRPDEAPEEVLGYVGIGTASSVASGRVAYTLGLEGPAVTVDTACSSGLTAVHLAMESLRRDECTLVLAGGVTVMSSPGAFTEFRSQGGLAEDGRCKPFSRAADGFGLAEGAGVLVLQRLSVARAEGRPVLAVLRGSAINQDGASNGLTAPSGPAQRRVIRQALERARLRPVDVDYVEAHGTGTRLGDPIEAHALLDTYGADREPGRPLWVGSVKSNIGHTQAAAGVAGVMKTVLALRHREIPATLHFDEPSPHVDWDRGAVSVVSETRPWPVGERPRRAGVSSFGISGTNAHVIVEEAPSPQAADLDPTPGPATGATPGTDAAPTAEPGAEAVALVFSARDERALRAQAARLADRLTDDPAPSLRDTAFTLVTRRATWEHRAVVVGGGEEVLAGLRAVAGGRPVDGAVSGRARAGRRVVLVFPGQGAQWQGMARDLLRQSPTFAESIDACERALAPHVDWSLREVLDGEQSLDPVDVVQPVLFAVMVSLARLWQSYGVTPGAVVGHSQGEIAAAHVAGALSLADAARVVALRSRVLRRLGGHGGMASFGLHPDQAAERIARFAGALTVASVNGPRSVVLAGENGPLDELIAECEAEGVTARRIPVDYASHSPQVESLREELLAALAGVRPVSAGIPLYSTLTGQVIETATMDADYWFANLREPVRFQDATRQLAEAGFDAFVEVSPHPVLTVGVEATLEAVLPPDADPCVTGTLRRERGGLAQFHTALAEAYTRGVEVDWRTAVGEGRPVDLPVYPFQRQNFWLPVPLGRVPDTGDEWRYQLAWHPVDLGRSSLAGRVLVVTGAAVPPAWTDVVRDGLEQRGATVVLCTAQSRARIGAALDAVDGTALSTVVSLLALAEGGAVDDPSLDTLALVQALGAAGIDVPLWLVTRDAAAVTVGDDVDPAQAMVGGLGRVVGVESPARWGGLVDLREADADSARSLAAILADPRGEEQFAIRPDGVTVARLVPAPARAAGTRWTPRGTVLVTGGTGGIGAHLARWLAGAGAEHLVLLNRRGAEAAGAADLRDELVALGTGVTITACDVADRDRLAAVLDAARAQGRVVTAVFHAAGISRSTAVQELTESEFTEITDAKVRGTANLAELCPELDALVLFSSNAAVWGSPGLASYAAGNAFLDAFARRGRRSGLPVTSIAWGLWAGQNMAGTEGGDYLRSQGLRAMDPQRAIEELRTTLDAGDPWVSVVDLDRERFVELFTAARRRPLFDELGGVRAGAEETGQESDLARRLASMPEAERHEHVARLVRAEVAAVLGHGTPTVIERDVAFRDLGFDSMTAVDLRNRLAAVTGVRVATTIVFDHPTVDRLTAHYLERLVGEPEATTPAAAVVPQAPGEADEPIAIVGMACRLAGGVRTPDQLWDFIVADGDAVTEMPSDRSWDLDALFDPDPERHGTSYSRHGAFLDGAADFDAAFFGISPREALAMDPQQRQVLETTWELFENAGIDPHSLRGTDTGVFLGAAYQGYGQNAQVPKESEGYLLTGGSSAVASGRIAYVLGLEGPAITVDTACSSSLVALHVAAGSLRSGDCGLAVAGGVSVMAGPEVFTEFSRQGALAPDGRCKPFSDQADGFGFAEGVAVVLLQRLSVAVREGRRVLGVVVGSAVNQDGASNGLAAPSGVAQQRVIRRAWGRAGVSGGDVGVVEAHGTGTRLGDPVELGALLGTYGVGRGGVGPVVVGSVKANVGHVQAAAGVVGVIKVVLGLGRGLVGPMVCRGGLSGLVDWSSGGLVVADGVRGWPVGVDGVRRGGVSAFGVSGTNAHVVVAEAPGSVVGAERPVEGSSRGLVGVAGGVVPVVLSAKTETALTELARRLHDAVDDTVALPAVAATLATGRAHLPYRAALLARDHDELRDRLRAFTTGSAAPGVVSGVASGGGVVFVFPGQGGQWVGMARGLLSVPVFVESVVECDAVVSSVVGFSVLGVLEGRSGAPSLDRVDVVQPVLFVVMVSLARLWRWCGVVPAAVVGHSQGEIAAAVVAGVLSVGDGARVVALRARALRALAGHGGMVSLAVSAERARELIAPWSDRISVAAVNSPTSVVVSGDPQALAALVAHCAETGERAKTLPVDYASHSAHVEQIRDTILTDLADVTARRPDVALYSTLHGARGAGTDMDARYWYDNLRSPVRFDEAVEAAVADGYRVFVEMSPHPVLTAAVQEIDDETVAIGSLHRDTGERHLVAELARAHVHGVPVDWRAILPATHPVPLPNYPFEATRYWLAPTAADQVADHRYRVDWRPLATTPAELSGSYLVFGDAPETLGHSVEKAGGLLVPVAAPDRESLAVALDEAAGRLAGVLSFAADTATHLARHRLLGEADVEAPLWLVTSGGVALDDHDPIDCDQAMVWGIGRVMGLETPHRWGGLVDVTVEPTAEDGVVFAALLAADDHEDQVALRDGIRHGRRLVRAPLTTRNARWTPAGTALVTGGTGALGGHVARYLARSGVTDLVLLSRSGPDAPGAAELAAELADLGAEPRVEACDVTDGPRLRALVQELREQDRPVRIVVHTAGVPDSRPLDRIDELESVSAAKVTGARLLDELCPDADTFVLFSSGAGVWGSANLGAYAAANAYLDALAHRRRQAGRAATSVAWGAWAGDGMATGDLDGLTRRGLRAMAPDRALRACTRRWTTHDTCVSVADVDWDRFAVGFTAARPRPLIDELVTSAPVAAPTAAAAPVPAMTADQLLQFTRSHVAAILGHQDPDAVGLDQPFTELGFDSLTAVGLRNQLQQATGRTLPAALVFQHPTVRRLADHLAQQLDVGTAPVEATGSVLRDGYRRAGQTGDVRSYLDLLANLSEFRERFTDAASLGGQLELVDLADGSGPVTVICCAGTAALSGPHEFARLASALRGTVPVRALAQPGYEAGEPVPASMEAVLGVQADAVLAAQGDTPFVLVGHSAGALMAYALATELADRGHPPRGVVLLDVYPPGHQEAVHAWLGELTAALFDHETVRMDDTRLTALGAYDRLTGRWRPRDTGLPTLVVAASEPMGEWPDDGWQSTWPFGHDRVTVPGDHFSMVQEHADAIARHIDAWLSGERA
uniref:Megalomicin 6-deoxyerythronolide B synthase 3 n=2 Tax=Micromonospora TaxID=1873 RepID=Q9F828_MICMH|nr:megalomicin 6-deoxyerythronolide B synthase 3 [Micromonospora megalomicea subsp. nigra]